MSLEVLLWALVVGIFASLVLNVGALVGAEVLAERYRKKGVLRLSPQPSEDAPDDFAERMRRRERSALGGSLAAIVSVGVLLSFAPPPQFDILGGFVFLSAFLGRAVVLAVLGAREASEPLGAVRVARGSVLGLAQRVSLPWWLLLVVAQAAFLSAYVAAYPIGPRELPTWVAGTAGLSLVVTVASFFFARWLAPAPQGARTWAELEWSDAVRRRDLVTVLIAGPALAFAVTATAYTSPSFGPANKPVFPLAIYAWVYTALLCGLCIVFAVRSAAKARQVRGGEPVGVSH